MFTGVYMGKCIIRTSKDIHCLSHSENTIQAILVCVFISCTQKTQGLLGSTWNIFPLDPMHDWCSICANCPILCKLQDVNKSILQIKGRRTWFYAALWSTIHIHTLWWLLQYMHILIFWFHRVATSLLCVEGAASFSIRIFHSSLLSSFFFFFKQKEIILGGNSTETAQKYLHLACAYTRLDKRLQEYYSLTAKQGESRDQKPVCVCELQRGGRERPKSPERK